MANTADQSSTTGQTVTMPAASNEVVGIVWWIIGFLLTLGIIWVIVRVISGAWHIGGK